MNPASHVAPELGKDSGDLIFRTVQVVSRARTGSGGSQTSVKTVHYGFLAVAQIGSVETLVRETVIDNLSGVNAR